MKIYINPIKNHNKYSALEFKFQYQLLIIGKVMLLHGHSSMAVTVFTITHLEPINFTRKYIHNSTQDRRVSRGALELGIFFWENVTICGALEEVGDSCESSVTEKYPPNTEFDASDVWHEYLLY